MEIPAPGQEALRERAQLVYLRLAETFGLPGWDTPSPPLDELVNTILSQNTNDRNRDLAYNALRSRFATWEAVRDADPETVIQTIRPAGLANQKGPRIQAVLRQITEEQGTLNLDFLYELPPEEAFAWLKRFKGVGPKTASIVLQFSLSKPAFPVDTHVYRVSGRIGLRPERMSVELTHEFLARLFTPDQYGSGHLNLIRLGRQICHARKPECPVCPVKELCDYFQQNGFS
ncbi:MAG: endonuclease III [Chloroflexi bacterium]|nr:MAG: endonuclease III [Chloroflexota bacterium]